MRPFCKKYSLTTCYLFNVKIWVCSANSFKLCSFIVQAELKHTYSVYIILRYFPVRYIC